MHSLTESPCNEPLLPIGGLPLEPKELVLMLPPNFSPRPAPAVEICPMVMDPVWEANTASELWIPSLEPVHALVSLKDYLWGSKEV